MRCAVEVAAVHAEPQEDAEQVTQALRGEVVVVEERQGAWARVVTGYGYPGWMRLDALTGDTPLDVARTFLGAPYEWGGLTVRGIDCSGLVHIAYRLCGVTVPRDADQQEGAGVVVPEPELEPGDLITYGDPPDHVAFWVGDGVILHSTGREDGLGVVEEREPDELGARRHRVVRLDSSPI